MTEDEKVKMLTAAFASKPIENTDADKEIRKSLGHHERVEKLMRILAGVDEENYFNSKIKSFVFKLSDVTELIEKLHDHGKTANGLRVYYGSVGAPTVLIVGCEVQFDTNTPPKVTAIKNLSYEDQGKTIAGVEYPDGLVVKGGFDSNTFEVLKDNF